MGQIAEARTGFVFLAFAMLADGEIFFTDWTYRPEDSRKRGYPVNWQTAFRGFEIVHDECASKPLVAARCHFPVRAK